jgi:hypothetical protein
MCTACNYNVTETIQIAQHGHGYFGSTVGWSQTAMKSGPIFVFTILSLSLNRRRNLNRQH